MLERLRATFLESLAWTEWQPNDDQLWIAVRRQATDILLAYWRDGDLAGWTADQAFSVRCDRTTMTQSDLDSGRLVLLVGVALQHPAEFTELAIGRQVGRTGQPPSPTAPLRASHRTHVSKGVEDGLDHRG